MRKTEESRHRRARISEHTYENTHVTGYTYASTHTKNHHSTSNCQKSHFVWTFRDTMPHTLSFCVEIYRNKRTWKCQQRHFVWKFTDKMRHPLVTTSIKHGPLYSYPQNPFNMAMLFPKFNTKHETQNKANAANSSGAADR